MCFIDRLPSKLTFIIRGYCANSACKSIYERNYAMHLVVGYVVGKTKAAAVLIKLKATVRGIYGRDFLAFYYYWFILKLYDDVTMYEFQRTTFIAQLLQQHNL